MNKIYCIGSLYNSIDKFEKLLNITDSTDTIYILGNFSVCSWHQPSQITYIYFYNLINQKNKNLPNIKLIKGKNENDENIKINSLNDLIIDSSYQYIKNMNLSTRFDFNLKKPTVNELYNFLNELDYYYETNCLILVSGFINPNISIDDQINNNLNDFLNGSPGKINLAYYEYCKRNKFRLWTKKSIDQFLNENINYFSYKTIDQYNQDIKNKLNKIIVCGNWYDPNFKKSLDVSMWSNLIMIDGGIGRSLNNEDQWFFYKKDQERLNVLDITNINEIKWFNIF